MSGQILAMGGGSILSADSLLEDYLRELSRKRRPRVGFLPTAGGERAEGIQWFYDAFAGRDSYGPRLRELGGGLGVLGGSFCPHFDGEPPIEPRRL